MIKTITLKFKSVKNEDILMVIKRTVMIMIIIIIITSKISSHTMDYTQIEKIELRVLKYN